MREHGVCNISQKIETKDAKKRRALEKYGVDNVSKAQEVRDTISAHLRNMDEDRRREIMSRSIVSAKKQKRYTLPSGLEIIYQGFENFAIDRLLLEYPEGSLRIGHGNVPTVRYEFKGKKRVHYPDIFIADDKRFVEVKSEFTYNAYEDLNKAKKAGAISLGYDYDFWIFAPDGRLLAVK